MSLDLWRSYENAFGCAVLCTSFVERVCQCAEKHDDDDGDDDDGMTMMVMMMVMMMMLVMVPECGIWEVPVYPTSH